MGDESPLAKVDGGRLGGNSRRTEGIATPCPSLEPSVSQTTAFPYRRCMVLAVVKRGFNAFIIRVLRSPSATNFAARLMLR
jgi:hypothetical protein